MRILRNYKVAPLPSYKCCPLKGDRLLVTTWAAGEDTGEAEEAEELEDEKGEGWKGSGGGGDFQWSGLFLFPYCDCHSFSPFSTFSFSLLSFWERPGGAGELLRAAGGLREVAD